MMGVLSPLKRAFAFGYDAVDRRGSRRRPASTRLRHEDKRASAFQAQEAGSHDP